MSRLLYDAAALIETVRNRAFVPNSNSAGTQDDDILRYLNEELQGRLFPLMIRVREEFLIYTIRTSLVASTNRYRINKRAGGNRIRDVIFVNTQGSRRSLVMLARELIGQYGTTPSSSPRAFYLEANHLVLVPDISSTPAGQLEISYYFRPAELVLVEETAIITAVDTVTGAITLATAPTAFAASVDYDIHSPHSGAEIRAFDLTASAYNSVTQILTFTPADIDGSGFGRYVPLIGDYVCLSGECAIPSLPRELHPTLAQAATVSLLRALGDEEAAKSGEADLNRMLEDSLLLLEDRVEGEPQVVTNTHSFLRGGPAWGRGRSNEF